MNPDGFAIPITEDDQGEQFKNPIEEYDPAFQAAEKKFQSFAPIKQKLLSRKLLKKVKEETDEINYLKEKIYELELSVNRILLHLGIADKNEIIITDKMPIGGGK